MFKTIFRYNCGLLFEKRTVVNSENNKLSLKVLLMPMSMVYVRNVCVRYVVIPIAD